jgi:hypothetical protein
MWSPTTVRVGVRSRLVLPRALAAAALVLAVMTAGAAAATSIGLTGFLLGSGEQTAFRVSGHPATQSTVKAFVNGAGGTKKEKQIEAAQLEKAGFVAAADEQLRASHGRQGFSLVMEFGGSAGARAAVAVLFKNAVLGQQGAKLAYFKVKGVAGTHGVTAVTRTVSTANVYWTEGRCTFGSGDYVPKRASAVSKPVIRGVLALQARTKGTCP